MKVYVSVFAAALLLFGCNQVNETKTKAPIRVTAEVVLSTELGNQRTYVGVVEESEATAVSFTSMGTIKRVFVNEGQTVKKGQLIAEMDDTQAANLVKGAEAQMEQANDAFNRFKMLYDNGSLPEVQWVEIQSKVAQAKSQLDVAKKNLADCQLKAPVSGIIGKKMIGIGETALPSQAVVNILDINTVKVKVAIPETEIGEINANTPTIICVEAVGDTYQGGHIEKGVDADALTHTYDIRINIKNIGQRLLPGMVASVSIETPQERGLMLPITSVHKKVDGSMFVWTIGKDSIAHRTAVSIGHTEGNCVEVIDGLSQGQRVVTEGYQKLNEGTKVIY